MPKGPKGSSRTNRLRGQRLGLCKIRGATSLTAEPNASASPESHECASTHLESDWCGVLKVSIASLTIVLVAWIHHDTTSVAIREIGKVVLAML